ncbi:MAG: protein phosphatase 2C domain-containing protein [Deltaproteobacteria bacterium]|jgi:serine/threonine protein phosphatase PrpC
MRHFIRKMLHPQPKLAWFGRTDTGRVRSHNEDAFCILEDRRLLLVADGMGGHQAGEVASRLAVDFLAELFSPEQVAKCLGNPQEIRHLLVRGLRQVNEEVIAKAQGDESLRGMGCTLLAGLFDSDTLHTCHVGDTRCYQKTDKGLQQITTDHTAVAARREPARIPGAQPSSRRVLTKAIGFPFSEDPEYHELRLNDGDRLLFCSDGLWSMLPPGRIETIMAEAAAPEQACDRLVEAANEAGGRDNITAVIVFL